MKRFTLHILATLLSCGASAQDLGERWNTPSFELLEKKCILTKTSGMLPTRFETVVRYLNEPELVRRIQQDYRRSISKDGTVDYPILDSGHGSYYYVNEKKQRTDISELYRVQTSESSFDLAYHAEGNRYFGSYEVLIFVRIIDAGPAGAVYTASVHAYPHNGPIRFLARRFGTVEKYFKRKTRTIAWVSQRMCSDMGDPLPLSYPTPLPTWPAGQQRSATRALQNDSTPPAYWHSADPRKHI
jgi:hypothetical protein